jgi:hypothetical protein
VRSSSADRSRPRRRERSGSPERCCGGWPVRVCCASR